MGAWAASAHPSSLQDMEIRFQEDRGGAMRNAVTRPCACNEYCTHGGIARRRVPLHRSLQINVCRASDWRRLASVTATQHDRIMTSTARDRHTPRGAALVSRQQHLMTD